MSNYTPTTDFSVKDGLTTGDPEKVILGSDIDDEFDAIATAITSKEDSANKGASNGYCGLDAGGLVAASDLPTATESAIGALEIATNAEAVAKTATDKTLVPSNLPSIMAAPGAIGGTTPAAVTGTTVTGSTVAATSTMTLGGVGVVTTARTLTASTGLSGGGDLSANRSFSLDISGLTDQSTTAVVGTDGFLIDDGGTMKRMSYNEAALPLLTESGNQNFATTDVGCIVAFTGTTATWTMPTGIGANGCYIIIINSGSGALTIAGSGVTVNSANSLLDIPAGGMACLIRESSTVWFLGGSLE